MQGTDVAKVFSEGPNQRLLVKEGLLVEQPYNGMQLFGVNLNSPANAKLPRKPVVDCSMPTNWSDSTHQSRSLANAAGGNMFPHSIAHFAGVYEQVPYTETYSSYELAKKCQLAAQLATFNKFVGKFFFNGGQPTGPKYSWAHGIWIFSTWFRYNMNTLIGCAGYLYMYEALYTYVPGFKIRDPSPNGWKRISDDGQTTYEARVGAAIMPMLAHAFNQRSFRGTASTFIVVALAGVWYDLVRMSSGQGMRQMMNFLASQQIDREARYGSLMPESYHRVDGDSNKDERIGQFRYFRLTVGQLQESVWETGGHDYIPMYAGARMIPDPYWNWQKAKQGYGDKIKFKNDMWKLPSVIDARMMSGAMDRQTVSFQSFQ